MSADTPRSPRSETHEQATAPATAPRTAEFAAFYRRSAARLVTFLRWHGAPLADATELAQETLTRCFQRWDSITHPDAWCRMVAARLYIRRVAEVEDPVDDVEATLPSPLLRAAADIEEFENLHTVLRLIDDLPPRQRQILAWTYDGASDAEIAAVLYMSREAVRSSRRKARAALRHLRDTRSEQA